MIFVHVGWVADDDRFEAWSAIAGRTHRVISGDRDVAVELARKLLEVDPDLGAESVVVQGVGNGVRSTSHRTLLGLAVDDGERKRARRSIPR